jgi:hypothetical protein
MLQVLVALVALEALVACCLLAMPLLLQQQHQQSTEPLQRPCCFFLGWRRLVELLLLPLDPSLILAAFALSMHKGCPMTNLLRRGSVRDYRMCPLAVAMNIDCDSLSL